jgi:septal ring factor EnvC (AmiA/AmiB activator)
MKVIGYSLTRVTGLFFLLFMGITITANAQNYEKLRRELQQKQDTTRSEIEQLKQQITSYQNQISQTEKKFAGLNKEYENLKKEIALRNAVIKKLENERNDILKEIKVTQKAYDAKAKKLKELIANYQKTLSYLYKHGRTSEFALILTAHSFNQMLIRAYYLRKFELYRQNQANEIKKAQAYLKQKENELTLAKEKNTSVLSETQQERKQLRSKVTKRKQVISALRRDKRSLQDMLHNTRKEVNNLNNTLSDLISKENKVRREEENRLRRLEEERKKRLAEAKKIKDAAKRKQEVAKYSKPIDFHTTSISDAELKKLGKEFANEKGKLPWPVHQGVITAHFGTKVNPVYGTRVTNLGIEITTKAQSPVHTVSDGYIFAVKPLTGFGNLVFVNHGKYKTVYGNLSKVLVHKDMIVRKGDVIGLSGDKYSAKGNVVFFMIRDGNHNVNPEKWIKKHS